MGHKMDLNAPTTETRISGFFRKVYTNPAVIPSYHDLTGKCEFWVVVIMDGLTFRILGFAPSQ